jgi:hypothetical protein
MLSLFFALFIGNAEAHSGCNHHHHHRHHDRVHYPSQPSTRPGFRLVWDGNFWFQVAAPNVRINWANAAWVPGHYRRGHWIPGHWVY